MNSESKANKLLFDFAKDSVIIKEKLSNEKAKDLMRYYEIAAKEIEDKIYAMYFKYAKDNKITVTEVKALISSDEQKMFKIKLSEYMARLSFEGNNSKTKRELDRLALKSRLNREEKILSDIYMAMGEMADKTNVKMSDEFKEVVANNFVRASYEIQKSIGVSFVVDNLSDRAIKLIIEKKWAKKTFSESLWGHMDTLHKQLREVLAAGFMSGASTEKMVKEMRKRTGACKKATFRLIQNQCQYFANEGERRGYIANGIEKYVFLGAKELRYACDCASLNNAVIKVSDAKPLENFPPLHPHCICTTRAYFEESILDNNKDTYPFDEDMSMGQWREKYVRKNEEDLVLGLKEELGCDIISVERTNPIDKALAGKASYLINKNGGITLNIYDDKGYVIKSFDNNDHLRADIHKHGKLGEHVHDWSVDKKGINRRGKHREALEEEERIMNRLM